MASPMPEHVTITIEEFIRLTGRDDFLSALEAAGVDNWEGYDIACRILEGEDIY